jgi:hypothetical protein
LEVSFSRLKSHPAMDSSDGPGLVAASGKISEDASHERNHFFLGATTAAKGRGSRLSSHPEDFG